MDTARYFVAVLVLVSLPPALLLWLAIHPLARFWRRFGVLGTYALLALPTATLMWLLYRERARLLGWDLGTSWPLVAAGAACFAVAAWIALERKRYLTFAILVGTPELSRDPHAGRLLREGPYAHVRHPRYVEVVIVTLGYALFANHLGTYLLWALSLPVLFVVVLLEERELAERFGADYEEYCRRVPRFVPRRRLGR